MYFISTIRFSLTGSNGLKNWSMRSATRQGDQIRHHLENCKMSDICSEQQRKEGEKYGLLHRKMKKIQIPMTRKAEEQNGQRKKKTTTIKNRTQAQKFTIWIEYRSPDYSAFHNQYN